MSDEPIKGILMNKGDLQDFAPLAPEALDPSGLPSLTTSSATLLACLSRAKPSGLLRVMDEGGTLHTLGLQRGSLILATPAGRSFEEAVIESLIERHMLAPQAAESVRATAATPAAWLQTLFKSGECTAHGLVDGMRAVKEGVIQKLIHVSAGRWEWRPNHPLKRTDPVAIDLLQFLAGLLRDKTKTAYSSEMDPLLRPIIGRYPIVSPNMTPPVAAALFSEKERKILDDLVDGASTLKDVMSMSLLSRSQTSRMFLLLTWLGLVDLRDTALPKGGIESYEKELKSTYDRLMAEDHFMRLGMHWTSHPSHYEAAYRKMVLRWGPTASNRKLSPRCDELITQIMALMDEAYHVVSNKKLRDIYRNERFGPDTMRFSTDFLFKQANLALFREEFIQAREIIESAIDIMPRPEFMTFLQKTRRQ
jgi:hypothetical protein